MKISFLRDALILIFCVRAGLAAADLDFCLKTAVLNNHGLLLAAEDIKISKLKLEQVGSMFRPKLSLGAYYDYYSLDYPSVFSSSLGAFNLQEASDNLYGTRVTLTQPLYTGGAVSTLEKQASQKLLDSGNMLAAEKNRLLYGVKEKYINVVYLKRKIEALENALRQIKKTDGGGKAGFYSDMLRQKSELNAALVDNVYALNALISSEFIKAEDIGGEAFVDGNLSGDEPTKFILLAGQNRPELKSLREKESVDFLSLGLEQSVKFPNVDLFSTYDYLHAVGDEWASNFQVGISMSLPLYDGGARWLRFEEKKALLRKTKVNISHAEEAIRREVEKACRGYSLAGEYLKEAQAEKKNFRMPGKISPEDIVTWARITENELDAGMKFDLAGAYLEYAAGLLISKY
ncbi:MAG: TolC family protein [Candidatus Omnitrophota bacterium]|nr:TolC family protein [bacterium]MBU3930083.1 TolC family protein [bacterium]